MDCQRNGFPRAPMRLFGVVRVNRRHASKMTGVEGLQEVECLRTANLPDKNPVWTMPERRPHQIGDRHGGHWLFLAERHLRSSRFEANEIGLVDENLGRLFDQDD